MYRFILILLGVSGFCFTVPSFAQETNRVETNQVSSTNTNTNTTTTSTNTNVAQRPSEAELQAAAQQVWHTIVVIGILALVGATVVAGFALYGAYRMFGVTGVVVTGVIITFGVFALGALLFIF
jgi:hypothetical protein